MKFTVKVVVIGFIAGFAGAYTFYSYFIKASLHKLEQSAEFKPINYNSEQIDVPQLASTPSSSLNLAAVDFSEAASKATQSVVFINSISQGASIDRKSVV